MNSVAASETETAAVALRQDDRLTVCAVAALAFMLGDVLHEGLGHACVALATVAPQGVISTVAWSSSYDSRLVDAGGTLVNLAAGCIFWLLLRAWRRASPQTRLFLWTCCAFNLFTGTGYFFFSGVTNFGDWAGVIDGLQPHWAWRTGLIVIGILAYWGAVVVVGTALVRYIGVERSDRRRYWRICLASYFSAIAISTLGGLMNPIGYQYVLLSALPATAGADCGLLWMGYYVPRRIVPVRSSDTVGRSGLWIGVSAAAAVAFIFVLGRGIPLHR
jgi:hypothetical protein